MHLPRSYARAVAAALGLFTLVALAGCQSTGGGAPVHGARLDGAWQATAGDQVFGFGADYPLAYVRFDGTGSGTGTLYGAEPDSHVLACGDTVFAATTDDTVILYNGDFLGTVVLRYRLPDDDTLVLTSDAGVSQTLTRVDAVPSSAACGRASVAQSLTALPLALAYQSNLLVSGGTLQVAGDDRKVYPVSAASGALGAPIDLVSQWSHAIALQSGDYWGHCWCGSASSVQRIQPGGTSVDTIDTGTDLGVQLQVYTGAWDGSRLWLAGWGDDSRYHLLKVDANAEPDVLDSDFTFGAGGLRGLTYHDGALWGVVYALGYKLVRIDPATGLATRTVALPAEPSGAGYAGVAWLGSDTWLLADTGSTFALYRITF